MNTKYKRLTFIALPLFTMLSILYFLFSGNFDGWFYDKKEMWYPAILILILFPISAFIFFKYIFNSETGISFSKGIAALSLLILGPFFGYYLDKKSKNDFSESGVSTKGIITETFYSKGERMYYTFDVDGRTYTSFNESNLGGYKAGDTVDIIYVPHNPNNNTPKVNITKTNYVQ